MGIKSLARLGLVALMFSGLAGCTNFPSRIGLTQDKPAIQGQDESIQKKDKRSFLEKAGTYFKERGGDFVDIFKYTGVGRASESNWGRFPWLEFSVKATDYARGSLGMSASDKYEISREGIVRGEDSYMGWPFTLPYGGTYLHSKDKSLTFFDEQSFFIVIPQDKGERRLINRFDLEVSATVLFPSAKLCFSLGESLDFILGCVGADIAKDDKE